MFADRSSVVSIKAKLCSARVVVVRTFVDRPRTECGCCKGASESAV